MKFETAKVEQVFEFIEAKGLLRPPGSAGAGDQRVSIKATGGGAFKFAELFEVSNCPHGRLGLSDEKRSGRTRLDFGDYGTIRCRMRFEASFVLNPNFQP